MTKRSKDKHDLDSHPTNSAVSRDETGSSPMNGNQGVLNSWKEIAAYLGKSVRTVQRMEVELGLPIRRPKGHARSSVVAIAGELDEWLKSFTPQRNDGFSSNIAHPEDNHNGDSRTRVLVVDDQEITAYTMSRYLRSFGFEVATTPSGREAIELASSFADIVLLDMNLPEMHGLEVLRRLRTGLTTSHIPVICTSATYPPEGAAPVALQLGAKRFLHHPIEPDNLRRTIEEVLRRTTLSKEA